MQIYLESLNDVINNGIAKGDRTGTGTRSIFGPQYSYDLSSGFPLLTTKKMFFKGIVAELLWFLKGYTNIDYLHQHNVRIWDEWADEYGEIGPIYGKQWRKWDCLDGRFIDQISEVISAIKINPESRRLIITAWNPSDIDKMGLPPCHCLFQFYVVDGKLSCKLYQRSADIFLGVPFNIASYALLTMMVAKVCDLVPDKFIHSFGDLHLYNNHLDVAKKQLQRLPILLPSVQLKKRESIFDYTIEDIELIDYFCHPPLKAPVAV